MRFFINYFKGFSSLMANMFAMRSYEEVNYYIELINY